LEYIHPNASQSSASYHGSNNGRAAASAAISPSSSLSIAEPFTLWGTKSAHSAHSKSVSGVSPNDITGLLTLTATENAQLDALTSKMKRIFANFQPRNGSKSVDGVTLGSNGSWIESRDGVSGHIASNNFHHQRTVKRQSADELKACYREVPEVFFETQFFLFDENTYPLMSDRAEGKRFIRTQQQMVAAPLHVVGKTVVSPVIGVAAVPVVSANSSQQQQQAQKRIAGSNNNDAFPADIGSLELPVFDALVPDSHDKLTVYLDLVEVALLRQIWLRSPAFFRALDNITGLQFQVYFQFQRVLEFQFPLCAFLMTCVVICVI
jgi:hypothetical protein